MTSSHLFVSTRICIITAVFVSREKKKEEYYMLNDHSASTIDYKCNDHGCKILFIIWPFKCDPLFSFTTWLVIIVSTLSIHITDTEFLRKIILYH